MNEYTNDRNDKDVPLTRCYWDQSALLQSEWSETILGKYEGLSIEGVLKLREKSGVIPLDWSTFLQYADLLVSEKAFAVLLPMDKAKLHSKVAFEDQQSLPQAVISALADERNVDTEYIVFDIVRKSFHKVGTSNGH